MELGATAQECCCLLCQSGADWELRVSAVPLYNMRYDISVTFPLVPKSWCDGVSLLFRITVCSVWTKASSGFSEKRSLFFFGVTMSQEHKMDEKKNETEHNTSTREKKAEKDVRVLPKSPKRVNSQRRFQGKHLNRPVFRLQEVK